MVALPEPFAAGSASCANRTGWGDALAAGVTSRAAAETPMNAGFAGG
jgi:hypothetical protein